MAAVIEQDERHDEAYDEHQHRLELEELHARISCSLPVNHPAPDLGNPHAEKGNEYSPHDDSMEACEEDLGQRIYPDEIAYHLGVPDNGRDETDEKPFPERRAVEEGHGVGYHGAQPYTYEHESCREVGEEHVKALRPPPAAHVVQVDRNDHEDKDRPGWQYDPFQYRLLFHKSPPVNNYRKGNTSLSLLFILFNKVSRDYS